MTLATLIGLCCIAAGPLGAVLLLTQPAPDMPVCESCGHPADVALHDHSTWCMACHSAALIQGYDNQLGQLL